MKLIVSPYQEPALNLALEELLFRAKDEEFVLFYINTPSVIIGKNQVLQNEVNQSFCDKNNIQILRRISGGGAVYHDLDNLSYSFIFNKQEKANYLSADFLKPVIYALEKLDVPVIVGKRKDLWLIDNHKISGTAAHITADRDLHHGTILYASNLDYLQQALLPPKINPELKGIPSVVSPVKNIQSYLFEKGLYPHTPKVFFDKLISHIASYFKVSQSLEITADFHAEIKQLANLKYRTEAWNRRK